MMDMDEKKLLNILKLKEEFEKELRKRGKLKKIEKKPKPSKNEVKIKVNIVPPALVDASNVDTILDINSQDYIADNASVIKALKNTISKVGSVKKRLLIEGIINLLSQNFERAMDIFNKFETDEFLYMKGVTLLYMDDPTAMEYAIKFLRNRNTSYLPYILLSEILLYYRKYKEAGKFFSTAASLSKNPYITMISKIYNGATKDAKNLFTYCVNQGKYKALVAILSIYIETDYDKAEKLGRALYGKNNPCSKYNGLFWSSIKISNEDEKYPFCPRLKIMRIASSFYEGRISDVNPEDTIFTDPLRELFLGFLYFNNGDFKKADEYFEEFQQEVELKKVEFIRDTTHSVKKIGIRQFTTNTYGESIAYINKITSKSINETVEELLKNKKIKREEIDIKVHFKDPEILRLFFGQRHCKFLYQTL